MYRNLSPASLGLSCTQSELIELALTHKFGGFDLDLNDFQSDIRAKGLDGSIRFLKSARVKLNGGPLPIDLAAVDAKFQVDLEMAQPLFEGLQSLGVNVVQGVIDSGHAQRPYHENFEHHRVRLIQFGDFLAERGMRLGLSFTPPLKHRDQYPQPFITKAEEVIMLLRLVDHDHVGMVVDLWDWAVSDTSLDQLSTLGADKITEVRLADFPQGTDPTSAVIEDRAFPMASTTVDCVAALHRLAEMDYRGAITIAPHSSQVRGRRAEIVARVVEAHEQLFEAAGLDARGRVRENANSES